MYDLIVIGGGPAGMMGAATAGARGKKVLLLEKNDILGKKLRITGNGRCNLTNSSPIDDFSQSIVNNGKFMYSAFAAFDNVGLINLMQSLGVSMKVEKGNRVFPASDRSADVVDALGRRLRQNNVEIRLNAAVKEIMVSDSRVGGVVLEDGVNIKCGRVLLATGGMSYRQTGSTGDGYRMAKMHGHSIIEPRPALAPLLTGERRFKDLQGVTLENVQVRAAVGSRQAEQQGELLFTHFGLSGPAIINISSYLSRKATFPLEIKIDLLPHFSTEQLAERLYQCLAQNKGKYFKNALGGLLPQKMILLLFEKAGLNPQKQVDQAGRKDVDQLARTIKSLTVIVSGFRPINEAIITSGGINTKEINPSTLESKKIKGLYFAGEIMDVDALTGGYNLQIAFSSGYLSGASVVV
ncbi:MAG: NAD(P)/FAD-dependent oxidoreductase [Desulfotomaculaceae bacterium]|nr:NAD(P)/FAD-dependent oxidoreductase [Desulfotomaculaceae bacterium]MDD4766511.1 NAD(P)/FAD-dependent oxidoreductase [Desulfotomaculaceae bacterium]